MNTLNTTAISSKTGDDGTTSLHGERIHKSHPTVHFIGSLDELNAHIGLLRSKDKEKVIPNLKQIQKDLLSIGANKEPNLKRLEQELAQLESKLPPLKNFILPGGSELAAQAHVTRTIARLAERLAHPPSPYLNRLSDYLFLAARKYNIASQTPEEHWKSPS